MIGKHAFVIFEGEMAFFDEEEQLLDYQSKKSIYDKQFYQLTRHGVFDHVLQDDGEPYYKNAVNLVFLAKGSLFGEIVLLGKPIRLRSCVATEDSIILELNQVAFDLIMKDKLKAVMAFRSEFIYRTFPGLKEQFTKNQITSLSHLIWIDRIFYKD